MKLVKAYKDGVEYLFDEWKPQLVSNYKIVIQFQVPSSGGYNCIGQLFNTTPVFSNNGEARRGCTSYYSGNNTFINRNRSGDTRIGAGSRGTWYKYIFEFDISTGVCKLSFMSADYTSTIGTSTGTITGLSADSLYVWIGGADQYYPGAIFDFIQVYNGDNLILEDDFNGSTLDSKWTRYGNGSYTISGGNISFSNSTTGNNGIWTKL